MLVLVTDARKSNAPPTSTPSVALTVTGFPTTAPVTVTVPESHVAVRAVPVMVLVVPVNIPATKRLVPLLLFIFQRWAVESPKNMSKLVRLLGAVDSGTAKTGEKHKDAIHPVVPVDVITGGFSFAPMV